MCIADVTNLELNFHDRMNKERPMDGCGSSANT